MERYQIEDVRKRFEEHQAKQVAKARRAGRIQRILDKIFPPLQIEPSGSGEPSISVYTGDVNGIHRITSAIHNQMAGRPLDSGISE